jgi:hypothetical protein
MAMKPVVWQGHTITRTGIHPMDRRDDGTSDRRWVIVSEDGRYVTIGRAVDPTEDELQLAEAALRRQGLAGWLAVMSGSAYGESVPSLLAVRALASPTKPWHEVSSAWLTLIEKNRSSTESGN